MSSDSPPIPSLPEDPFPAPAVVTTVLPRPEKLGVHLHSQQRRCLIRHFDAESPLRTTSIEPGDVLLTMNHRCIHDARQVPATLQQVVRTQLTLVTAVHHPYLQIVAVPAWKLLVEIVLEERHGLLPHYSNVYVRRNFVSFDR